MMKRAMALCLSLAVTFTGCVHTSSPGSMPAVSQSMSAPSVQDAESVPEQFAPDETAVPELVEPENDALSDEDLLCAVEDDVYASLVDTLDPEQFYVEDVSTAYISKEYLEELEYNSQSNVFFGRTLAELDQEFQGTRYVFALDDKGSTVVQEMQELQDDTYDRVIKNVAIGGGIILVSTTVALITQNPAAAVEAGKAVKIIFVVSSQAAKTGVITALASGGIGGAASAITAAFETGDVEDTAKAALLGASEGFKIGAIMGTVTGIAHGITTAGNYRFFKPGTPQARKYPEGVEFTVAQDGTKYPRFEKWAKATAKFSKPDAASASAHTGLSGEYYYDAKLANAQCGFAHTPEGYVWHHVEDMQTMILVPQDVHSIAMGGMPHTGGAALIKAFLKACEGGM